MVTDKDLERAQRGKEFDETASLVKTGERPQVENTGEEPLENDIEPDKTVPDDEVGLAHTPPDPVRNGGKAD